VQCDAGKASPTPGATACTECSSGSSFEDRTACNCGPGSQPVYDAPPSGVLSDTTTIRLQNCLGERDTFSPYACLGEVGTPSFDSEGQVQGRLEAKVGNSWVPFLGLSGSPLTFGGEGSSGGEAESTVACRQLGNELGYTLVGASKVGKLDTDDGSGTSYQVICAGTELTLDSCPTFRSYHSIYHDRDVGVRCKFLGPGDSCAECEVGKFSNTTGITECAGCAAGSYSSAVGTAICEQVSWSARQAQRDATQSALNLVSCRSARPARTALQVPSCALRVPRGSLPWPGR
jgi:hypothetical protein